MILQHQHLKELCQQQLIQLAKKSKENWGIKTTQELTDKHLSVLIALQENPLGTYDWIASRVNLSKSVVFGLVQDLSQGPLKCFNVVATANLWNLGLESLEIIVEVDSEEKTQIIEKLSYVHPYTFYRARCFGDSNGLLVQFNIPMDSHKLIIELFEILKKKKQINDFIVLPFRKAEPIFTTPNLDHWNAVTNKWKFNWDEWFNCQIKKQIRKEHSNQSGMIKEWLTQAYIGIIHHLGKNARRKNLEIIEDLRKDNFEFTPQTFSRYVKKVKKDCIKDYRVYLTPTIFDLYSTVLIWGSANEDVIQDLESRILQLSIPFSSTFKIKDQQLFWYLHLPPSHLSNLLFNLRKKLRDMHFNYIDYNRATSFLPWPPTFDENKRDWRIDREFLIDNVLKELEIH